MGRPAIALVGAGVQMRRNLLPVVVDLDARVAGVVDLDLSRARELAASLGAPVAPTLTELAETTVVDAVIAACPPAGHEAVMRQAIALCVPVMVEKPPTVDSRTLRKLDAEASAAGVPVVVGLNYRHAPGFRALTRSLDQAHGEAVYIHALHLATGPAIPSWGVEPVRAFMLAQAIHAVDQALVLVGQPREVRVSTHVTDGKEISVTWLLEGDGVTTCIHAGNTAPGFRNVITAVLRDGTIAELRNLDEFSAVASAGRREYHESRLFRSPFADVRDRMGYASAVRCFLAEHVDRRFGEPEARKSVRLCDLYQVYELLDRAVAVGQGRREER